MNIEIISRGSAGDKPFDVPDFLPEKHFFLSVVGSRGSGKSLLVSNLLKQFYLKEFDYLVVLCPTQKLNKDYEWIEKLDPSGEKYYFFTNVRKFKTVVSEILEQQQDMILDEDNVGRENTPNVLIIADDCASNRLVFGQHGVFENLALAGRHSKVSCIVISQVLSAISRRIRLNTNMLILFPTYNQSETEQFVEQYVYKQQKKRALSELQRIFDIQYNFIAINNDRPKRTDRITEGVAFKPVDLDILATPNIRRS